MKGELMSARVMARRKGRWSVIAPEGRNIDATDWRALARELREMHGVKRAIVRNNHIYMRVRTDVKGLLLEIKKKVASFFKTLDAPPLPRRRSKRTNPPSRPSGTRAKKVKRSSEPLPAI